jgi:predicted nucleic acid-binding protein
MAPDIIALEVLSTLRRLERRGEITSTRAGGALDDFRSMPIRRWSTEPLLDDIWNLRMNVGIYDACYVALAHALECPLVTADARLSRVQGLRATIILASGGARLG